MNPEKGELSGPCNLCDYQSVCRFEPGLGGNAYRIAPQMNKAQAKEHILDNQAEEKEGKMTTQPEKEATKKEGEEV